MLEEDCLLDHAASHRHLGGYSEARQWGRTRLGANLAPQRLQHTGCPRQGGSNTQMLPFRLEDPQSRNSYRDRDGLQGEDEGVEPNLSIHQTIFDNCEERLYFLNLNVW